MKCNSCGAIVADTFTDCPVCGARLVNTEKPASAVNNTAQEKICVRCGLPMPQSAAFCPNCGVPQNITPYNQPVTYTAQSYAGSTPEDKKEKDKYDGIALASIIVSIVSCFCCGVGLVSGPVGFILGIFGTRSKSKNTLAIIGIVIGIIAFLFNIVFIISLSYSQPLNYYYNDYEEYLVKLLTGF